MKSYAFSVFATALLLGATVVFANDSGGGTNGVGANITLTDNGSAVTLANENISATISKNSGEITSLIYLGTETVQSGGGNIYYSMDGGTDFRRLSGCAYVIKTNSSDIVDVSFRQTWSTQPQAFDIEVHWVLRRGDSGLYAYAMLDHPASYPDTRVTEWRMVWKLPGDLLEQIYVDDLRHWQQPSIADINAAEPTSIAEILKLTTGVRAGHYDGKYQYAAEYENIGTWGHASNVRKIGTWLVTGNYEYFNDGPTKQDLCNDWEYQLIHFGRNHFTTSPASDTHGTNGIAWQKIYGPFLLYLNTNAAGGDALWADAKAQVQAEHTAWPYSWLTGNANYPQANERGAVNGRFLVNDSYKPSLSTSNAWVGLTATNVDWQFDADHYQYWVRAVGDGSFSIQNVRPGLYTLHAFTDGEMNEFTFSNVVVTASATNTLGDLMWNVPHAGNFLLWEVGVPNRSASEYRHGTTDFFEGFIWDTFPNEFPNPLEYNIGSSDWSRDLNYVHNSYKVNGTRNPWKWRLNFFMTSVPPSGNATLNMAFASEHNSGVVLNLYVNNEASVFSSISVATPPAGGNALVRQSIHGKYYFQQISIPVSNLRVGSNTITLIMASQSSDQNHFMYDAMSLELPSKPPLPSGLDLSWSGGLVANTWDIGTTANWSSNTTARVFSNGNRVLFDDTGLNNPNINLAGNLQPASVAVFAMKNFTFAGNGSLSGTMTLAKAGPGTLTINNTNTFTGATTVTNGALIVNGALNQSAVTLRAYTTLGGTGRLGGGVTLESRAILRPAMNLPGTLVISNSLVEQGRVTNYFDLSNDTTGTLKTNDLIRLVGNLSATGTNWLLINPLDGILADGIYPLIQYSGTFTGTLKNFTVNGVVGKPFALTNPPGVIALVIISNRPPANVTWKGGLNGNAWDQSGKSNWLNGAALDVFAFDDAVTFDNSGAANSSVNLVGDLTPSSVTVNASANYTFSGSGNITGDSGLTKLNSGTLTILTTNDFTGPISISGGTIAVTSLPNGGVPGALGASTSDSSNLVLSSGATLRYLGATAASDHGATLNLGGGAFDVTNALTTLTLNGTITGDGDLVKSGSGTLVLAASNSYAGSTLINDGILQMGGGATSGNLGAGNVINNATLLFNRSDTVTVDSAISGGGIVVENASGQVILANANSYTGGTTNAHGTLVIANDRALGTGPMNFTAVNGSSVQLANGVIVTNAWNIPGSTADVMLDCPSGSATWAGPVTTSGGGSFRPGTSTGSGTLIYSGNASMGSANFIVPRGNVTIAGNGIISAGGTVCALGRSSSGTGTMFVAKDNASLAFSSGFMLGHTSSGTPYPIVCTLQDNATLSTGTGNFDLHNGANASATTVLNLNGGTLLTGGFVKSKTGAGQISTINFNGGTVKATIGNIAFLGVISTLTANVSTGGAIIDDNGFTISIGQSLLHSTALGATLDGGLTKLGSGTLIFGTPHTYNGPTIISNGTLALVSGAAVGSFANSTNISVNAGALFDVSGRLGLTLSPGQTIQGSGAIKGNFVIGNGARLSPGNSIGTLTFSNSLALATGSTTLMEISKSPFTNDTVKVFGALTNGGTLVVTNISAEALAAGDSFKLFDAGSYVGTFSSVSLPSLPFSLRWNINLLNMEGVISVVAVQLPVIQSADIFGGNFLFSGTNGDTNGTYYVLTATNIALPVTNWTRLATNQFDSSGSFIWSNAIDPNSLRSFFRLELP